MGLRGRTETTRDQSRISPATWSCDIHCQDLALPMDSRNVNSPALSHLLHGYIATGIAGIGSIRGVHDNDVI